MGRRQLRQDVAEVSGQPPPHIDTIELDDEEISFRYTYTEHGTQHSANLRLLPLNVDDYPIDNEYMLFAGDDSETTPAILGALEIITPILKNKSIGEALIEVSTGLHQAVTSGKASNPIILPETSDVEDEGYDDAVNDDDDIESWMDAEEDDDAMFGFTAPKKQIPISVSVGRTKLSSVSVQDRKKIKADLRQAKDAGFRVGVIGDLTTSGIVCVSIRIAKLGISEEALPAWSLTPQEYFVVLIRFQNGYRDLESLKEDSTLQGSTEVRLGLCSSYKPNTQSAFDAFNELSVEEDVQSQRPATQSSNTDLRPLFIGRPLNELFAKRFTNIVKFREIYVLGWSGAEQLAHDTQGATIPENLSKYDSMVDPQRALPSIVTADSMSSQRFSSKCSLPLVAMQFALRHFVRCTDFCLVCHCSTNATFEALKPYVCSNPLCLFQYMGLGFGPSIEWEILSQPYVVDLLISFCYVQASAGRLKDFPEGIDLRVPVLPQYMNVTAPSISAYNRAQTASEVPTEQQSPLPKPAFSVRWNGVRRELLFKSDQLQHCQMLKKGDYIALISPDNHFQGLIYYRIDDKLSPSVRLGAPIHVCDADKSRIVMHDKLQPVDCYVFDHGFDELSNDYKCKAIMALLDTIPPVKEMLQYLKTHSVGQDSSLKQWRERISPSALNILRWIIASNRSCIMQVDKVVVTDGTLRVVSDEDRVSGMDDYMQFRFAQGAPDKEQRFLDCVEAHAADSMYPTLFAWHGSPLYNWHSIIREGLNFKDIAHGRAFGNGVYMSNNAGTSIGYQGGYGYGAAANKQGWKNSELKITGAMSLNEVVNKRAAFVSKSPHYVVKEIDWIQTRYLLVKTCATHSKDPEIDMDVVKQDPSAIPFGSNNQPIRVPKTAMSRSRQQKQEARHESKNDSRKRKISGRGEFEQPIEIEDDIESVGTLAEDREYLVNHESHSGQTPISLDSDTEMNLSDYDDQITSPKKKQRQDSPTKRTSQNDLRLVDGCLLDTTSTDFSPGQLDLTNVQRLPPPEDATPMATTALQKAFRTLIKTQASTPAHELGWYIDPEQVDNIYQWIVELHSFDKDIPLSRDMKNAGINSVVLEMRFTNQYPFAPPFVRVIKPRFLPFNQGGGGHVTEGGAICMELLTNNGWTAVSSIESVLLQIRLAMSDPERPAKLPGGRGLLRSGDVYNVGEAIAAYERACRAHGWTVPPAFSAFKQGGYPASR